MDNTCKPRRFRYILQVCVVEDRRVPMPVCQSPSGTPQKPECGTDFSAS